MAVRPKLASSLPTIFSFQLMSQGIDANALSREIGFDQFLICNGLSGVGAVIIGTLAHFALGGRPNTIAAAVVGGLAGGCLGLFV